MGHMDKDKDRMGHMNGDKGYGYGCNYGFQ